MEKEQLLKEINKLTKEIQDELDKKHEMDMERFNKLSNDLQKNIEEYYSINLENFMKFFEHEKYIYRVNTEKKFNWII